MLSGLIIGILLGFVLQRGRFCVTGAFRDLYVSKNSRMFTAFLIAITIQSIGLYSLQAFGMFTVPEGTLALNAVIIGGFLFGVGIVYAGGCATGTWYRAGEGLFGSWVALLTYALSAAATKYGLLKSVNQELKQNPFPDHTIDQTLGISAWWLVLVLVTVTAWLTYKQLRKPKMKIATLPAKRSGLAHLLFEKRWHPFFTAVLIGVIALLAWPLSTATGRHHGLGITSPTAGLVQFLTTGDSQYINWATFLVLGILVGSFIAAKGANEFKFRIPDQTTIIRSAFGGVLMGFGASLAGGCSIGNGLVETAIFSWQGWISLIAMILGTWFAAYFTIIRPRKNKVLKPQLA